MATTEGIGAYISACAEAPTTYDKAGYEPLPWEDIGEITDIPEHGKSHSVVTHTPIRTGIQNKAHGEINYGSLSIPMAYDPGDAGQLVLRDALESRDEISFRITYSNGSIEYTSGKVMSFQKSANVNNVVPVTAAVEFTRATIDVDPGQSSET